MKRIGIIGSHGYRARYGGWDQLMNNLVEKIDSVKLYVFNSKGHHWVNETPHDHEVTNLSLPAHGFLGMFFDAFSVLKCWRKSDSLLFLGNQIVPFAVVLNYISFTKRKLYVNPGGFEWERAKYNYAVRSYLKFCMNLSVKYADYLVFDNQYFADQFPSELNSRVIPYGASIDKEYINVSWLQDLGLTPQGYFVSVSRSIPDNQIVQLLENWHSQSLPIVLVSNLSASAYGRNILNKYSELPNIILIDGLYDKSKLDFLRRFSSGYVHTHKTCGSAPSLIEAIQCYIPIISFDVPQNRYTLQNHGSYFSDFKNLRNIDLDDAHIPDEVLESELSYSWNKCVEKYESIFLNS